MKRIKKRYTDPITGEEKWTTGKTEFEAVNNLIVTLFSDLKSRGLLHADNLSDAPLFEPYAREWLERYRVRKVTGNTISGYRGYLENHLIPFFGRRRINEITVDSIQDFMNRMQIVRGKQPPCKPSKETIKKVIDFLAMILDAAVEADILAKNPAKSKSLRNPSTRKKKREALTMPILTKVISGIDNLSQQRDRWLLVLILHGLRRGEVLALRGKDICLEEGIISINKSITYADETGKKSNDAFIKSPKSKDSIRDVYFLPLFTKYLEEMALVDGYIIDSPRGTRDKPISYQGCKRTWERIQRELPILQGVTMHQFRHTYGTIGANTGDLKSLSTQIGHYDTGFTMQAYVTPQAEPMRLFAQKVSDIYKHGYSQT